MKSLQSAYWLWPCEALRIGADAETNRNEHHGKEMPSDCEPRVGKLFPVDSGSPSRFSAFVERVTDDRGSVRGLWHVAIGLQSPHAVMALAEWLIGRYTSSYFASAFGRVIQHRIIMIREGINLVDHHQIKSSLETKQLMRRCKRDAPRFQRSGLPPYNVTTVCSGKALDKRGASSSTTSRLGAATSTRPPASRIDCGGRSFQSFRHRSPPR